MQPRNAEYRKLINSRKWRGLRFRILSSAPLCEHCASQGFTTAATEVHHIKPIERGESFEEMKRLAYDRSNLVALCHSCHVAAHVALSSYDKKEHKKNLCRALKRFADDFL